MLVPLFTSRKYSTLVRQLQGKHGISRCALVLIPVPDEVFGSRNFYGVDTVRGLFSRSEDCSVVSNDH